MTHNALKLSIANIKCWVRGDQRAPHKPLLILYVIAKYLKGHSQLFSYTDEVEPDLLELLKKFGPTRKSYHPSYPFWRLRNDGFWKLTNNELCTPRKGNTDPAKSQLIKHKVLGGFDDESYKIIKSNPNFAVGLIKDILEKNFPTSISEDLLDYFDVSEQLDKLKSRDPEFRRGVLRAYNYKCAVCGFDLRVDDVVFGIEAAHIKWKQFFGPCTVDNGLALCSIHHKAFDKGVIGFTPQYKIKISKTLNGGDWSDKLFYKFNNSEIYLPRESLNHPQREYLDWHNKEVFKQ
jgi:putative restriction endonuclease